MLFVLSSNLLKNNMRYLFATLMFFIMSSSLLMGEDELVLKTIQHNGIERTFYLYLPVNFDEMNALPVVLILHGGGKADGYKTAERTGYNIIADKENFIAVYPNGIDEQWNDGRGKTFRRNKGNENIDDVGFLSFLIDHLIDNYKGDPKRVYVTGLSNGGMMTFRLGCEIASKLAAIAPVIANIPEKIVRDCNPNGSLPVLIMNGTDDPLLPWNGGHVKFLGRKMGRVLSTENSVRFWVEHNKCFEEPFTNLLPDIDEDDDSRVREVTYGNKDGDVEVILYAIENGGHNFPGSKTPDLKLLLGNKNMDIIGSKIIWEFFKRHKKE